MIGANNQFLPGVRAVLEMRTSDTRYMATFEFCKGNNLSGAHATFRKPDNDDIQPDVWQTWTSEPFPTTKDRTRGPA